MENNIYSSVYKPDGNLYKYTAEMKFVLDDDITNIDAINITTIAPEIVRKNWFLNFSLKHSFKETLYVFNILYNNNPNIAIKTIFWNIICAITRIAKLTTAYAISFSSILLCININKYAINGLDIVDKNIISSFGSSCITFNIDFPTLIEPTFKYSTQTIGDMVSNTLAIV